MIINNIQTKQVIDSFFINNRVFISLFNENDPLLIKKIKDYNLEFEVSLIHSNSNIILIKDNFNEFKVYAKYDENKLFFEYSSDSLFLNNEKIIIKKKIEKTNSNLKNCKLEITLINNMQEISFINSPLNITIDTNSVSIRTSEVLSEKKDFNLFKKYVEEYNINLLRIVQGDETYLKELEQTFEIIFLTDDNYILKEICSDIFNILKIEDVLIKSKKKNTLNYFNLIRKKINAIF